MLAQLGSRIQHALRAYTPTERKAVKSAAQSFRPNPALDTEATITELGTGEALVSTLDLKGAPTMVERTLIRPPSSRMGPCTDAEREAVQTLSPVSMKYDGSIDRDSAYEILRRREQGAVREAERQEEKEAAEAARARKAGTGSKTPVRRRSTRQTPTEAATNTFMRTASREITQYIFRGIFGSRKR